MSIQCKGGSGDRGGSSIKSLLFLDKWQRKGCSHIFFLERGLKVEEGGGYLKFLHSPYDGIKMVFTTQFSYLRFSFF